MVLNEVADLHDFYAQITVFQYSSKYIITAGGYYLRPVIKTDWLISSEFIQFMFKGLNTWGFYKITWKTVP